MEEKLEQAQRPKRKAWVSIVAVTLSVLLVASLVLLNAASVKISLTDGSDAQQAAASSLTENNAYIEQEEFTRIGDVIRSVLLTPDTLDDYYLLANMQIAQGKYEAALGSIEKCFLSAPEDETALMDDLWTKKGCIYAILGDYDKALESFGRISDGGAGSADVTQIAVQIAIGRGDLDGAAKRLGAYLEAFPEDTEMRALMAQVYYLEGDLTAAEEGYTALLAVAEDTGGEYHLMRASCRDQLGEYEGALDDYAQAAALGFEDAGLCWAQCALCAYQLGRSEEVLSYGAQAVKAGSDDAAWDLVYEAMGVSALQLSLYEDSVSYFSKAIELNMELTDVYYYRGVAYMALTGYEAAVKDFTASIRRDDRASESRFNRALCYIQTQQIDAAREDLEAVAAESTDEALAASAQALLEQM